MIRGGVRVGARATGAMGFLAAFAAGFRAAFAAGVRAAFAAGRGAAFAAGIPAGAQASATIRVAARPRRRIIRAAVAGFLIQAMRRVA